MDCHRENIKSTLLKINRKIKIKTANYSHSLSRYQR